MTIEQERRIRRKRRMRRNLVRGIRNIVLFPGKMPRITFQAAEQAMKACEFIGVVFVVLMIAAMTHSSELLNILCILCATCFIFCIVFVKLREYQIALDENEFLI